MFKLLEELDNREDGDMREHWWLKIELILYFSCLKKMIEKMKIWEKPGGYKLN